MEEMQTVQLVVAVIPSLNPNDRLRLTVQGLFEKGFSRILLVDDGSDSAHRALFDELGQMPGVTVLRHEVNRGKGEALKTAFSHIHSEWKDAAGVVTLDGDGQHRADDVVRVVEEMLRRPDHVVLGVRDFSSPDIPKRSRNGNRMTCRVFKLFCHLEISDTQTGLRAFSAEKLPWLISVAGSRYEYETNVLLDMGKKKIPYAEVKIETIYLNENEESHFRPIRDSVRIYWQIFGRLIKYACNSVFCVLVEGLIQTLLHSYWSLTIAAASPFLSAFFKELLDFLPSRLLSSILNYFLNRKLVFNDGERKKGSLIRYYILWTVQAIVTALATTALVQWVGGASGILYFLLTSLVKTVIFFASYFIQKNWVFKGSQ
ncbi:MAG: bifunctional glycosyltransferase family 2/GtrA family protein [Clostridia bacterium]|nr:bifunctional glycosyltransferase family 2/GtrA family protein [Clostridia bacterium]